VQDNISLILPLVFHLASTHLGSDTQRQIHWSVEGPRGSETPTLLLVLTNSINFYIKKTILPLLNNYVNNYLCMNTYNN
jgi:hypothetical protein